MPSGGTRPGAGRKKGKKSIITFRKEAVLAEIRNRVMQNADKLFNAQFAKAVGSIMVFEVIEKKRGGNTVTEHLLVTDPETIKAVLDEGEGSNASVDGSYYLVTEVSPDTRAIDSMFDRTFGKAQQSIEVKSDPETERLKAMIEARAQQKGVSYEQERQLYLDKYALPNEKDKLASELGAIG